MNKIILIVVMLSSVACMKTLYADSKVEFLNSGKVVPVNLPFSEAVRVDDTLYLSGQIGIIPGKLKLVDGGMQAEAKQTMDNIKTTLEAHGYAMSDIVKCTIMLADISEWKIFNEVYQSYFTKPYPARSAFGVNGLAFGARLEVECIAIADKKQNLIEPKIKKKIRPKKYSK